MEDLPEELKRSIKRLKNDNPNNLRVIKTARDEKTINEGVKNGYKPLLVKVVRSEKIRQKFCVYQNIETLEVRYITDFREEFDIQKEKFQKIIDWSLHYPYQFPSPFAAYLLPSELQIGEKVFLEDVIEDYISVNWNQGDTYRLKKGEAIWNGTTFEICENQLNAYVMG